MCEPVKTPNGSISVITEQDGDYPCVKVFIRGQLASVTEYDSYKGEFRTHVYNKYKDEPVKSVSWK